MSGGPIREPADHRFLASSRRFSQLGTPFIGSQTEPSTNWRKNQKFYNFSFFILTSFCYEFGVSILLFVINGIQYKNALDREIILFLKSFYERILIMKYRKNHFTETVPADPI